MNSTETTVQAKQPGPVMQPVPAVQAAAAAAVQPCEYAFKNWRTFYHEAVCYHNATKPDKQLVSDRILTLRAFMTSEVVDFLGAYVMHHPRYETSQGWDDWTKAVEVKLKAKDESLAVPTSANGWLWRYENRWCDETKLWHGLDTLVSHGALSLQKQRTIFWKALPTKQQNRMAKLCAYFDPQHAVWSDEKPGTATFAAQKMVHAIEYLRVEEEACEQKRYLAFQLAGKVLIVLCLIGQTIIYTCSSAPGSLAGMISWFVCLALLHYRIIPLLSDVVKLRDLHQQRQRLAELLTPGP